jgi:hypothetical protein
MQRKSWFVSLLLVSFAGIADAEEAAKPRTDAKEATKGEADEPPCCGEAAEPCCDASATGDEAKVSIHGTVEAAWGYNLNDPSNHINNFRYYDARHNLPGLQGAALTTDFEKGGVKGRIQLQLGVLAEMFWGPVRSTEQDLMWRLLQEVTTEWQTPIEGLALEGGVFNVPFGPEYNLAYQNWNWSTSNMFAIMPYQVAGARMNYALAKGWVARLGVYNGWDQIVTDNNSGKSPMLSLEWTDPNDEENYFVLNYMAGNERDKGDTRGPWWRHTLDLYAQWHATERWFVRGHVFAGLEPTRSSTNDGWLGAVLFSKFDATDAFSLSGRADLLKVNSGEGGQNLFHASFLTDPTLSTQVVSGTLTADFHPRQNASLRLEVRHDRADFPLYFGGQVERVKNDDGSLGDDIATERQQTTVTVGLVTWF